MRRIVVCVVYLVLGLTLSEPAAAQLAPPVSTYSIVARDPVTGDLGVAVQSHWFSVGTVVTWAEAGVGAVATQSFFEVSYGPLALKLMKGGKSAPEALRALTAIDPQAEYRQVAMVDAQGRVAVHTGTLCIPEAGHHTGDQYSVQANLMENDTVWDTMARAYESTPGDLADRFLAALEAAEGEGGDIRGRQSVAMLIVPARSEGQPWRERLFDIRVEDNPQPLAELRRFITLRRAYDQLLRADTAFKNGQPDHALAAYAEAVRLEPDSTELRFWQAVSLARLGHLAQAEPIFAEIFAVEPRWRHLVPRLSHTFLPDDPALVEKILACSRKDPP